MPYLRRAARRTISSIRNRDKMKHDAIGKLLDQVMF